MSPGAVNPDPMLNEAQAAEYRGLSPKTLQQERWLGKGPRFIRQGRRIVYRRSDLEQYLAECAVESDAKRQARRKALSLTPSLTRTRGNQRFREIAAEFQTKRKRSPTDQHSAGRSRSSR
jgi:hypothetical protein